MVWDERRLHTIEVRQLRSCREAGLLAQLVIFVNSTAILMTWCGGFAAAASLIAEAEAGDLRAFPGAAQRRRGR
jgi:hypothetical protein